MTSNRRNWGGWLLIMVFALFAVAYIRRDFDHTKEAAKSFDKKVANHESANHTQSPSQAPAVVSRYAITADGTTAVPVRFQLPNVGRVMTARSFQEWLAQYPLNEQSKISAFNKAHFGVYQVNSREQVAWMAANGYPMPEDVVAAEKLGDNYLLKLAEQGNDKAAFLLAERQNKDLVDFLAGGGDTNAYYDGMEGSTRLDDQTTIERLVKQSNSPYKGYLQASEAVSSLYEGESQNVIDVRVIAGLSWAQQLGDMRAGQFMSEYVGQDPQRMVISDTVSVVFLNDAVDMAYMARNGGQRAGAAGRGIPSGGTPVN